METKVEVVKYLVERGWGYGSDDTFYQIEGNFNLNQVISMMDDVRTLALAGWEIASFGVEENTFTSGVMFYMNVNKR